MKQIIHFPRAGQKLLMLVAVLSCSLSALADDTTLATWSLVEYTMGTFHENESPYWGNDRSYTYLRDKTGRDKWKADWSPFGAGDADGIGCTYNGQSQGHSVYSQISIYKHNITVPSYTKVSFTFKYKLRMWTSKHYHFGAVYFFDSQATAESTTLSIPHNSSCGMTSGSPHSYKWQESTNETYASDEQTKELTYDNMKGSSDASMDKFMLISQAIAKESSSENSTHSWAGVLQSDASTTYTYYKHYIWDKNDYNGAQAYYYENSTANYSNTLDTYMSTGSIPANRYERDHYYFDGWNTSADGTGTSYAEQTSITVTASNKGEMRLYAQWKKDGTWANYKTAQKNAAEAMLFTNDSQASKDLVAAAKTAIDAVDYTDIVVWDTYQKKVDAILTKLTTDLKSQHFADYKAEKATAIESLAREGDSDDCATIITNAKTAINALAFDDSKTLDELKATVELVITKLTADLLAQRQKDYAAYQTAQKAACDALQMSFDETVCKGYVTDAKKAIDALKYDDNKTPKALNAAVDDVVTNLDAKLKAHRLVDAQVCYDLVTAVGAKVEDKAHNDNYTALKTLIDAKSTDGKAVTEAIEDCYRQYYYDQLASEVLIETRYLKKNVNNEDGYTEDDNDQANLTAALAVAADLYGDGNINKSTPSADYKATVENLKAVVATVVANQYKVAKAILDAQITTSTNTKDNDLAYDENKTSLQTYIDAAKTAETNAADGTKANVLSLRTAASNLKSNTETVVNTDKTQAQNALATAITEATTYKTNTVAPVSDVVANALAGDIADAQTVKDDAATTAKQAKAAADDLNTAKANAETALADFQDAKKALNDAITAATTDKGTYDAVSTGAKAYLQDAIDDAQAVADDAKAKTTAELKTATSTLNTAKAAADKTNTSAIALNGAITNATAAKTAAVDATEQTNIQNAIDAVKPDMADKAKLSADLDADLAQLNSAVSGYVNADIAAQRKALEDKIAEANNAINNTMAYDANKNTLAADVDTASDVDTNASATAKELSDATTALDGQITSVTATDDAAALETLKNAITTATTRKTEIAAISQEVADALAAKITVAEGVRDNDNTAKVRDAAATTLNGDVTTANTDLTSYSNDLTALKNAITAATTAKDGYAATHTGVKDQLADAIATAQGVVDNAVSTKTADIVAATNALNAAKDAADKANTAATNLETSIATAKTTLNSIVDATVKGKLETAISTAEAYLSDKTATEATLIAAKNTLDNAVSSNVTEDIDLARTALSDAITAAETAKANLGYDANKTTLAGNITTATDVKNNTSATAKELDDAKTNLNTAKDDVVKTDLEAATTELGTSLTKATTLETSLKALSDKIDAKYADEKAAFNTAVISALTNAIAAAQTVQDATESTGKAKVEQVAKLAAAVTAAKDALTLYYNTELQKLADEYTADKDLVATVSAEVTVLDELDQFSDKYEKAEEVYVSIKSGEDTYDAGDVIAARLALKSAADDLKKAKSAWDDAVKNLEDEIVTANTELAAIQACHTTIAATLQDAIDAAVAVDAKKGETKTADLVTAYETLKAAVEAATYDDLHWDFTDATPDYKEGTYAAGNVTYTRSGSAIYSGAYGSFCLPFDVKSDNFKAAYVPAKFACWYPSENVFKLCFKHAPEVIPAGTPFLAVLESDSKLELTNANDVIVASAWDAAGAPKITETEMEVYEQSGSSLLVYNGDIKMTWSGTLAKKTDVVNTGDFRTISFARTGSAGLAGSYINPFRSYLTMETTIAPAKNANIVVSFDEGETTGIENVINNSKSQNSGKIYSVDGKYVGNNADVLKSGMYIINGKKVIK